MTSSAAPLLRSADGEGGDVEKDARRTTQAPSWTTEWAACFTFTLAIDREPLQVLRRLCP